MKENLLKPGDLSLNLKHPTDGDRGRYVSSIENRNIIMEKTVLLQVKGSENSEQR
ncbi:hypothetical protein EXN66_Car014081 [Channa argus]|uniref:Uncharacterized protein n=1 Tax=Channa argus TaxID=215402 RepID=A0A6G1Q6Y2_CHAAH|nr:hypothetical protein EXN66_Car014081 [Channa argus]